MVSFLLLMMENNIIISLSPLDSEFLAIKPVSFVPCLPISLNTEDGNRQLKWQRQCKQTDLKKTKIELKNIPQLVYSLIFPAKNRMIIHLRQWG